MSLNNGDLRDMVLPTVSIDSFEPKAGGVLEVIVVAFYVIDKPPADDLNTFIQRGFIDTLDVEVSPSTDEDGRYLVFVEMARNDTFPGKFKALLKDVTNLTGKIDWEITSYLSDERVFKYDDPELFDYVIIDPDAYVTKDEFKMTEQTKNIEEFIQETLATNLTVEDDVVIIEGQRDSIVAEVIDIGDYDTVVGRNFLNESAFAVGNIPHEARMLQNVLGNCAVVPLGNFLCVGNGDKVMLLKNTQIVNRKR